MAGETGRARGNPVLRFFGMETRRKSAEVFLWSLPYMGLLALGLGGMSFLVQLVNPLPLWVHVLAILFALTYLFLFLARLRQAGSEVRDHGEKQG